jgi:hypothetical protein
MKIWVFLLQRPYSRTPLLSQSLSIIFAVAACAFSLTAAQPSDALLRIIPDVQQRLKSSNWTNSSTSLPSFDFAGIIHGLKAVAGAAFFPAAFLLMKLI